MTMRPLARGASPPALDAPAPGEARSPLSAAEILDLTATLTRHLQSDLGPTPTPEEIFEVFRPVAYRITDFESLGLVLVSDGGAAIDLVASDGEDEELEREIQYQLGQGVLGWALRRHHAVTLQARSPDRWVLMHSLGTGAGAQGLVVGVLRGDGPGLPGVVRELLSVLLFQCAAALENAELHRQQRSANERLEEAIRERTEELQRSESEARAASRAKSDFVSHISHEIRAPINGITGTASLLERTGLDSLQREFVDTIIRSADTVLEMVGGVLDLSRIESGRIVIEKERVDLRSVVDDAIGVVATKAVAAGVQLSLVWEADAQHAAIGDAPRVRQIVTNLLDNAIRYTDEGDVCVRVARATAGSGPDGAAGGAERLVVSISDTGVGIAEDKLDSVFERFERAGSGGKVGFGLGLAISRELARLMSGDITVESTLGEGSTFHLSIPAAPAGARERSPQYRYAVVVSRHACLREGVGEDLCAHGFDVQTTAELGDAEAALARGDETLLVVDASLEAEAEPADRAILARLREHAHVLWIRRAGAAPSETSPTPMLAFPIRWDRLSALMNEEETESAPEPESDPGRLATLRVLAADDEPVNRTVVTWMLEALGVQATIVENGQEAIDAAATSAYDVVLMDCEMPVVNGFEATRRIAAMDPHEGEAKPVIVGLTGHALEETRQKCLAAGMIRMVTKPLVFEQFTELLEELSELVEEPAARPDPQSALEALKREAARGLAEDWPTRQQLLRDALVHRDIEALMAEAHRLKGAALVVDAAGPADAASELEVAARAQNWDSAPFLLGELELAMCDLVNELEGAAA